MNFILIGFKNSGKTSIGQYIATKTNRQFIDTDYLIEEKYYIQHQKKLKTAQIYQTEGEEFFRTVESICINNLGSVKHSIIATGGGTLLHNENIIRLKKIGQLIYLNTSFSILNMRKPEQPIPQQFVQEFALRSNIYKKNADIEINTENKSIKAIGEEIINLMSFDVTY